MRKHYDPQWNGRTSSQKATETPHSYVTIVMTDLVILEKRALLLNLIIFYNSRECISLQTNKKNKLFAEILMIKKELKKYENVK